MNLPVRIQKIGRFGSHCLVAAAMVLLSSPQATSQSVAAQDLPEIGDPADRYLSPAQEVKISQQFLRSMHRSGLLIQDPEINSYMQYLGTTLANGLGNSDHKFTFFVVNSHRINAFAVPGGVIGINSGLVLATHNESELAGVLAHEIAHVAQRHTAKRIADMASTQIPSLGAMLAGAMLTASGSSRAGSAMMMTSIAAQQQLLVNFTRNNEIEADRIGLNILYNAGYDPRGMSQFFQTMKRRRFSSKEMEQFSFLMTHPLDRERIIEAEKRISKLKPQPSDSSEHYAFAYARLRALTHKSPAELLRNLEKQPSKGTDITIRDYTKCLAHERLGNFSKANSVIAPLAKHNAESIPLQLAHARILKNIDIKKSVSILRKLNNIYPNNFSISYYYADILNASGKSKQASDLLKNLIHRQNVLTVDTYKLLAEIYNDNKQFIDSKRTLSEYYYQSGNYNAAVFQLKDALKNKNLDAVTRGQIETRLKTIIQATKS